MFGSKQNKSKLLAFAVVAMFAIAVVPFASMDSDAGPYGGVSTDSDSTAVNQKFTVELSTGQEFIYSGIETNLDGYGDIAYAWTNVSGNAKDDTGQNGIKWDLDNKTLSGKFTTAGTHVGKLTATWTSPESTGVTQVATQQITFVVTEAIDLIQTITAHAQVGATTDKTIVSITYSGGADLGMTVNYGTAGGTTTNNTPFTISHDSANSQIVVKPTATLTDANAGEYKAYVTLTNGKTSDADTVEIILNVYKGIGFGNTVTHYYTYEGGSLADIEFSITYETDGKDETTVTSKPITVDGNAISSTGVITSVDGAPNKVHVNTAFTDAGDLTGGANYKDYVVSMTANGSIPTTEGGDGPTTSTATQNITVTMYKSFQFTSKPVIDNVIVSNVAAGSNSMNLSAYIAGAKSVSFNWGDGTVSDLKTSDVANTYAANHTYAKAGVYMITITATNDMGTTTSKVMYNNGETGTTDPTTPDTTTDGDKKDGFFDEHGYLFLVFALIGVGALVAFLFYFNHPAVIIVALVALILAAALYVYVDFAGIIEAVKDLLGIESKA